jgi:hypothetical protein
VTTRMGERRLRDALGRLRRAAPGAPPPLKPDPTSAFEVAIAERLIALQSRVDELRTRVNWLLTLIVGAAITNVVIALLK